MFKYSLLASSAIAALILSGCGSSSTSTDTSTGYLVDSAVANADYDCIADGDYNKTTGENGEFHCRNMHQIRFRLGELVLGEVDTLPADGYVFPQDILGVERNATVTDEEVTAMAQLLQSLDSDHNATNGIHISNEVKTKLEDGEFHADALIDYADEAEVTLVDATEAQNHLRESLQAHQNTNQGSGQGKGPHGGDTTTTTQTGTSLVDVSTLPFSTLTPELKDAMAHMGNEERLAYDVYMNLYNYHKDDSGIDIFQLYNIAQNSEQKHVATVQTLVQKYDLSADDIDVVDANITEENNMSSALTLDSMPSGVYDIPAIQELYDTLYAKGIESQQDALEVGCMVEVTDVNDLDEYIELAQESNASDIEQAFTSLRAGSYNHYWAFDKGLKAIGVEDGCCSLGAEWCHPEYPENSHGN